MFEGQQINQKFDAIISALATAKVDGLSPEDLAEYYRLLKTVKILQTRISHLDPELYDANIWGNVSNWLNTVQAFANKFVQAPNVTILQNANNTVDELISAVRPFDAGVTPDENKAVVEASAAFQKQIVEALQDVKARAGESRTQLGALSEAIKQAKTRLDENDKTLQQQKARLDQSIAEHQSQFSVAQEKRTKDFADIVKSVSDELLDQKKKIEAQATKDGSMREQEFKKHLDDVRIRSDAHYEHLRAREKEVDRIFGAIGSSAFAGNFKNTADEERCAANYLRWIALILMAAMIMVGGYAFYFSISHDTDWRLFLFRLGTVVVVAVPAFYAANESSKHRERERINRKIHLELASVDAYLVLLPVDERNRIKGELAEKFFGIPEVKVNSDDVTHKDLFGLVSTVVGNLTRGK